MAAGSIPAVSSNISDANVAIKANNNNNNSNKPTAFKPTAAESVRDIVNTVVNDVAMETKKVDAARRVNESLAEEKARIQSLINGLVKRVSDKSSENVEPSDKPTSPSKVVEEVSATPKKQTTAISSSAAPGVRLDDHRTFCLEGTRLSWTQSSDSVTVYIAVPAWVKREHVVVKVLRNGIGIRVSNNNNSAPGTKPVFETMKATFGTIDHDSSMWMLDGIGASRNITLELEKSHLRWWSKLFTVDDPAKYIAVPDKKTALGLYNSNNINPDTPEESPENTSTPPPPPSSGSSTPNEGEAIPPPPDFPPPSLEKSSQGKTVEQAVEEAVADVTQAVCDGTSTTKRERRRVSFSEPEEITRRYSSGSSGAGPSSRRPPVPKQKMLTVTDVEEMLEKNLEEVAKKGPKHAAAALQVGMVYWHAPYGIPKNARLAAKYLKYGLENGALDSNAAFQLGMMCNSGDGCAPDHAEAVRWWTLAANLGNAVAMFNLGVMKMNGTGCDLDPIAALNLFAQAHNVNPRLRPPSLPQEVINERIAMAQRLKKERAKRDMSDEEKEARRTAAMDDLKLIALGTSAVAGMAVALIAFRHWWKNTL